MTVAAILRHKGFEISAVQPTTTVSEVARILTDRRIGAVLVQDAADQLLGIVSERDIIHALSGNGARALEMTAGQLMTRALKTVTPRTSVREAMTIMTASRIRHLPVLDAGALIGIISIGDVVKMRIMQQEHEVDELKAYVAGSA
ncbi:MAG TPA: CBS domain-containing protein [Acetobacteraceae bacterium]|jgi:CBS domain-containing protein|nr:CBS domain-containing protein [Acetobacteraceae bacterium]